MIMRYRHFQFTISDDETAELLIALLAEEGFEAFMHNASVLDAYIPDPIYDPAHFETWLEGWRDTLHISYTQSLLEEKNWNAEWEKNFTPIRIGERCLIRAPFHATQPGVEIDIIIEPRMSFGTGHHETTYLMAAAMLNLDLQDRSVCDAGTGTGILAILAKKLGADSVFAVDNEAWAYQNALDNVQINNLDTGMHFMHGDLELLQGKQCDVLLANINRYILLQHMSLFQQCVVAGGKLLVSGILSADAEVIINSANACGFELVSETSKNDWVCLLLHRL